MFIYLSEICKNSNVLKSIQKKQAKAIVTGILDKTVGDKKFIKDEAKSCMLILTKNCSGNLFIIEALCDLCYHPNGFESENSAKFLNNTIIQMSKQQLEQWIISQNQEETLLFQYLLNTIGYLLQGKRSRFVAFGKQIVRHLCELLGENSFIQIVNKQSELENGQRIRNIIDKKGMKEKKVKQESSIKDFIKQQKSKMIVNQQQDQIDNTQQQSQEKIIEEKTNDIDEDEI